MRADVGEPGLDLGDGGRILRALGRRQQPFALAVGRQHHLARRRLAARRLLRDPADPRPLAQAQRAGIGLGLALDQAQQRGLAAAVAADQADPVAGGHVHGGTLQQKVAADAQADVVQMQHGAGA